MKKVIVCVLLVISVSCSKNGKGSYCWRCHLTGGFPYQDRYLDTCTENENPRFQFHDANNNDLNNDCVRK